MRKPKHKSLNADGAIRIIGGKYGGRKLKYQGEPGTRPMKDRTREAVFNLIGTELDHKYAIDLFGGTGAMAMEAISRGASQAIVIEKNFPMAKTLRENLALLQLEDQVELVTGDVFAWAKRRPSLPAVPRVVFCCPPYALYERQPADIVELLGWLIVGAPAASILVVEYDERFSAEQLPGSDQWDIRQYHPATIAVLRL